MTVLNPTVKRQKMLLVILIMGLLAFSITYKSEDDSFINDDMESSAFSRFKKVVVDTSNKAFGAGGFNTDSANKDNPVHTPSPSLSIPPLSPLPSTPPPASPLPASPLPASPPPSSPPPVLPPPVLPPPVLPPVLLPPPVLSPVRQPPPKKKPVILPMDLVRPVTIYSPAKKYLTYLPYAGISNQFYSLRNAATIAQRLNRTLLIPPIMSHHFHDGGVIFPQAWGDYMDMHNFSLSANLDVEEWTNIKVIDDDTKTMILSGKRHRLPKKWRDLSEPMDCQVIDGFWTKENGQGADFAYQMLLDIQPVPVPGFKLSETVVENGNIVERVVAVNRVEDIVHANQGSDDQMVCLSFMYMPEFEKVKDGWDEGWESSGQHIHFLPQFEAYVEEIVAYRLRFQLNLLEEENTQENDDLQNLPVPKPPKITKRVDSNHKGVVLESFLDQKAPPPEYIAIHLRRGDIGGKCSRKHGNPGDCIVPLSTYKQHVDVIYESIPEGSPLPIVILMSDTRNETEKQEIDDYGWLRLDHHTDPLLLEARSALGFFTPAMMDSAILAGRSARWVLGSQKSSMSWVASSRLKSWRQRQMIYPSLNHNEVSLALAAGHPLPELPPSTENKKRQ